MIVKVSCHWDQVLWKKKNPGASSLSVFFVCLFFGEMSELQVSKLWCVLQVRNIYRCRSRELKLIYTDSKKQLTVPLACDQPQLWLLPHDISMQWRISLFFFFPLARGKRIHYPAVRCGAGGCVTLGWFGFHTCVGVWANLRSHLHWCWHIQHPSEICLSNCNMLCRKIRLLMLQ